MRYAPVISSEVEHSALPLGLSKKSHELIKVNRTIKNLFWSYFYVETMINIKVIQYGGE